MSGDTLGLEQSWQISGYFAASSWLLHAWDCLVGLDDEVAFIWPMAPTVCAKWLYFFGQYFTLAVQTVVFGVQVLYFQNHPMTARSCRVYRALQMTAVTLLMLCFDIALLLRIYALYGRRSWSCLFATCAVAAEYITTIVSVITTFSNGVYDAACIMTNSPRTPLLFILGTSISQTILVWLAYRKRERVVRSRSSIACVTIRDGILVFVCVTAFLVIMSIAILYDSHATTLVSYWVPTLISIGTRRIILNLQRVPYVESTQEFTSEVFGLDLHADSLFLSSLPPRSRPGHALDGDA